MTRSWPEELRRLEYSQRLGLRRRNVAAQAGLCQSSAAALFEGALEGGSAAAGCPLAGSPPGSAPTSWWWTQAGARWRAYVRTI